MKQLDLFGNPVPVAQPKPRKRSNANDNANENHDDYTAMYEELSSSLSSTSSVSRSLRDLGIHGQEAAFYTAMRQATKMAPHSIRCVIDALAQLIRCATVSRHDKSLEDEVEFEKFKARYEEANGF